jgi:hypothetical protein
VYDKIGKKRKTMFSSVEFCTYGIHINRKIAKKREDFQLSVQETGNTHLLVCFHKLHVLKRFLDTLFGNENNAVFF